ncbi:hypothetical protein V2J09_004937 [Rumex salicifolius]
MFSGHKGTNALNIFSKKWRGESSLTSGLLSDAPQIELSEYGRIPSPGSESPSGLLHGESLKVDLIDDLDLFFERIYSYYCEKGLWCIIVKWIVELLSLAFTICFSGFFLLFVDWNGLSNAKCGIDAVESGIRPCDLAKEALHKHPLTPFTLNKAIVLGYLGIFSVYWAFCFLRFFAQLKYTLRIRHFYYNDLHVTDNELQTMPWASVLEKIVRVQTTQQLCIVKDLSAHEVVMRLMRKENYLIGMINKGVLSFPISKWVPGAGPTVKFGPGVKHHRLILTKTLEWTLNWCVLQSMFDRNFCVRRDFISNPDTLRKRLVVTGILMLLLSPFLVIFMLVYLFLKHAEQFYNHPTTASSRRWSNLSRWMFREFNEVDHFFKHRINNSIVHASDYLKQFPSPIICIIAKFISFISGGFAAVLIIIAFLDESLLEGHLFGRNLFWYAAVFGTITAISRAAVVDELLVLDPEREMSLVVQNTHYMPKRWRTKEHTETVRMEFETLFQYTAMMWLEEMASIFLTPYLLIFVVPKRVDSILQFIADVTVNVEGVGHVCSFSAFEFKDHGNSNYGSPCNTDRSKRSSQGKMENFQSSYLYWQPDLQGMQFLTTLRNFRDQQLRATVTGNPYSTPTIWQWGPNTSRDHQRTRNSYMLRDSQIPTPLNHHLPRYHIGSTWLIDMDPRNHPYLLDWYYTYRAYHGPLTSSSNVPDVRVDIPGGDQPEEESSPFYDTAIQDANNFFREESTSSDLKNSHWWARTGPVGLQDPGPQASFLEPPDFNRHHLVEGYQETRSQLSLLEEEDQENCQLDWRNYHSLSRTTQSDVLGSTAEFKLHFDDIYDPSSR